jgi:hypothetical protein
MANKPKGFHFNGSIILTMSHQAFTRNGQDITVPDATHAWLSAYTQTKEVT